jgi:hypothetical protein
VRARGGVFPWIKGGEEYESGVVSIDAHPRTATISPTTHIARHKGLFWADMFTLGLGSGLTAVFGSLLAELFPTEIRSVMMVCVRVCF